MPLSVSVLGSFEFESAGTPVVIPLATARALLAYLAIEPHRPHGREVLATLFWPDQSRSTAYANLRQTLARMRRALSDTVDLDAVLDISHASLQWKADGAILDLERFERLLNDVAAHAHTNVVECLRCAARLQQAVALYRGELLEGLYLDQSQPFEEWLIVKREAIHWRMLDALHTLTQHYEAAGQFDHMRQSAARQLALEPWRESAHRQLIRAFALGDDRAGALAAYETCRRVLETELGVAPSPETAELYRQINIGLFQTSRLPAPSRAATAVPPLPATQLLGRQAELGALEAHLRDPEYRLVTLTGPGGVGKTHLSLQAAQDLSGWFEGEVAFVPLASIIAPEQVLPTIASVLEIHQTPDEPVLGSLAAAFQGKRQLLILDNFEQVISAAPRVAELLAHTRQLTILVTSRAALRVRAEHEIALSPLALPTRWEAGAPISEYPAIALFVERLQAIMPGFQLSDANAELIVAICRRLDGLPLAIELAAARTRVLSLKQLLQRLDGSLKVLSAGMHDLPQRHQTLRDTIEWSYNLLGPAEQRLYEWLAVFVGGSTLEAAEQVCSDRDLQHQDVFESLHLLVDNSLLRQSLGDDGTPRFGMLETIREYAAERLQASAAHASLRRRHAAYFLNLAEQAAPELAGGPSQIVWFNRVGVDLDNIRTALRWAIEEQDAITALRLAVALREFWMTRAFLSEGRQWLETALALADSADREVPAELCCRALTTAGWLASNSRDYAAAEVLFERSLRLARQTSQPAQVMGALGDLAQAARMQGDLDRAEVLYGEALAICRAIGDLRALGWMLCNLGMVAHEEYDDMRAAELLIEGVDVARRAGDMICVAWCMTFLGRIEKERGQYLQSAKTFVETLTFFRDVGHTDGIAFTLEGWAGLAAAWGDRDTAARLFGAAEALREAINRPQGLYERDFDLAELGDNGAAWRAAWADGRRLAMEQAIAIVLEHVPPPDLSIAG